MPLQFVQGYGMRDSVQLTTFSLLARRSRLRSERLGLIHKSVAFNFGNVTFVVTLLSSAVAMDGETKLFLPGLLLLCGWMLMATGRCQPTNMANSSTESTFCHCLSPGQKSTTTCWHQYPPRTCPAWHISITFFALRIAPITSLLCR